MIYEIRTYDVTPHKVPEVMKRFGDALEERTRIHRYELAPWYDWVEPIIRSAGSVGDPASR